MKKTLIMFFSAIFLILSNISLFAAPPLPVRIGGTITVDGTQLTQATDLGYIFKVTKLNGIAYDPVAEDTDGLNNFDWYIVDIPVYDASEQPGGAKVGETAVIHVYLNGTELNVFFPPAGKFQVGSIGTTQQINIAARPNNPPSIPRLIYPSNGLTGLGTTVEFKWGKCTDPDSDTVSYNLYYSDDPNFIGATPIKEVSRGGNGVYYAGTGVGLLVCGIIFSGGVRNKNNLLSIVLIIFIYIMLFASCGSGGGGGGSDTQPTPITPSNDLTQNVSGLSSNTTYYWKVVVDDGKGGVTESSTYSFTTGL